MHLKILNIYAYEELFHAISYRNTCTCCMYDIMYAFGLSRKNAHFVLQGLCSHDHIAIHRTGGEG